MGCLHYVNPFPQILGSPVGEGGGSGKSVRATGDKGQQEKHHPMYQHYQSSYELTDWSSMHKSKVHLHQVLWIYILIFSFVLLWDSWPCGWVGLWLFCHLFVFFACIGLPLSNYDVMDCFCFISLHFILLCLVVFSLKPVLF